MERFDRMTNKIIVLLNELYEENQTLKKELLWWKYRCGEDIGGSDGMTTERFEFKFNDGEYVYFYIIDNETGKEYKYLIDDELLKLLNELHEENRLLKLKSETKLFSRRELEKENEQLQQELFESEKECIMIDYRDNPIRRNDKIIDLKKEYKERFGRDFE